MTEEYSDVDAFRVIDDLRAKLAATEAKLAEYADEPTTAMWIDQNTRAVEYAEQVVAERDALAEKWQSVPWKLLKSVRDSVYDYSVRLERAAEDNEDRSYAWDKRIDALTMDQFIDEYAPQEPPHADR